MAGLWWQSRGWWRRIAGPSGRFRRRCRPARGAPGRTRTSNPQILVVWCSIQLSYGRNARSGYHLLLNHNPCRTDPSQARRPDHASGPVTAGRVTGTAAHRRTAARMPVLELIRFPCPVVGAGARRGQFGDVPSSRSTAASMSTPTTTGPPGPGGSASALRRLGLWTRHDGGFARLDTHRHLELFYGLTVSARCCARQSAAAAGADLLHRQLQATTRCSSTSTPSRSPRASRRGWIACAAGS